MSGLLSMIAPCPPVRPTIAVIKNAIHHTVAIHKKSAVRRLVRPLIHVATVAVPVCFAVPGPIVPSQGAALCCTIGAPYDQPSPWLYGPAYAPYALGGGLYATGYQMPLRGAVARLAAVPAGVIPEEVGCCNQPIATGGSPVITTSSFSTPGAPASGSSLYTVPEITEVPEPGSLLLLAAALAAWMLVRTRQ